MSLGAVLPVGYPRHSGPRGGARLRLIHRPHMNLPKKELQHLTQNSKPGLPPGARCLESLAAGKCKGLGMLIPGIAD